MLTKHPVPCPMLFFCLYPINSNLCQYSTGAVLMLLELEVAPICTGFLIPIEITLTLGYLHPGLMPLDSSALHLSLDHS